MSLEVWIWAADRTWGTPLHRFVALAIADSVSCYNDCKISVNAISEFTEIAPSDVEQILDDLQDSGSLELTRLSEDAYRAIFPDCEDLCNPVVPYSERQIFRARIVEAFRQTFIHCKKQGERNVGPDGRTWTIDRLIPGSLGGTYRLSNVALSCFACNVRRGNRLLTEPVQSLEQREKGALPWRKRRPMIKSLLEQEPKRRPIEYVSGSA